MRFSLRPDRVFSVYTQVTPQLLAARGIRLLLCDLDYTLAAKRTPLPDDTVREWLKSLEDVGIQIVILSNNRHPKRVLTYCRELGVPYIGRAQKPRRRGFREAMEMVGVTQKETAMLGDKLLTDMLGANRMGIWALMVEPKDGPVGAWNHVLHLLQRPFKHFRRERGNTEKS